MIAYDNEKYYDLEKEIQRKMLIEDVKKYGIEILDDKNIDRFKMVGKTLSIEKIINKMNEQIQLLK